MINSPQKSGKKGLVGKFFRISPQKNFIFGKEKLEIFFKKKKSQKKENESKKEPEFLLSF